MIRESEHSWFDQWNNISGLLWNKPNIINHNQSVRRNEIASDNSEFCLECPSIRGREDWMKFQVIWSIIPLPFCQTAENSACTSCTDQMKWGQSGQWLLVGDCWLTCPRLKRERERRRLREVSTKVPSTGESAQCSWVQINQQINGRNTWLCGVSSLAYSLLQHIYWMPTQGQALFLVLEL